MSDEKKLKEKENKRLEVEENKEVVSGQRSVTPPSPPAPLPKGEGSKDAKVKIKFFANRAAEGVTMDADGIAFVYAETANYLVSIGYAESIKE